MAMALTLTGCFSTPSMAPGPAKTAKETASRLPAMR
jgi:pectin methylesterase-like acyl-CoA thioesterase